VDDQLLVTSDRSGVPNIYRHSVDGSGRVESITPSPQGQYAASVSQHNRRIFLTQLSPLADILMFDARTRRAELIVARANSPAISPDGQWLAYQTPFSASSTTPGQTEVFVQRFPNGQGTRQRISSDGGSRPAWSRSGAELFFFDRQNRLTAVRVRATGSAVTVETAATLLPAAYFVDAGPAPGRPYDVGTDGRFLMIKADATPASRTQIVVVQNWSEELKQLAPVR
jgi:Tol biopolymer transport system component